ncbi:MAG TPA: hypothetical protein VJ842_05250, partial [Pyrinomonadaceae bacterium]|nr:hypothetical protein [Pyrinomonadaceae bacterium]
VLAQVYDARLQLSHFEIGGWTPQGSAQAMSADYYYYADGRIKFVDDLLTLDTYSHVLPTMQHGATARLGKLLYGKGGAKTGAA